MSIEQKVNGDNCIILLSEEIDLDQSPAVREKIKESFESCKSLSVDLEKVSYIDSSGIAALVEGMQISKKTSKEFTLINVSNEVMKVIKLAHLDKIFKVESQSGKDAGAGVAPAAEPVNQEVASDNIDITPSETSSNEESIKPKVNRDDSDDDTIKFKR
jgi:anti-sigma B factor antagonist